MTEQLYMKKIKEANTMIQNLKFIENASGVDKLTRRIRAEIHVLEKAHQSGTLKEENILCSNLRHLGALSNAALTIEGVVSVLKPFKLPSGEKIICDIVGSQGAAWYKVIVRNPKALHHIFLSGNKNATRPLHIVAKDFLTAANSNPFIFKPPAITFIMVSGISETMATRLKNLGIQIQGQIMKDCELNIPDYGDNDSDSSVSISSDENESLESVEQSSNYILGDLMETSYKETASASLSSVPCHFTFVNLDVTALIAYVSSTTNGNCHFAFDDDFLTEQASWERVEPAKKLLDQYFLEKTLFLCEEAADHFKTIINTIGGPLEKQRAQEILARCKIVPSMDSFELELPIGGKIKELSRKVFGTGHALKAPTVTSNKGFARSALNKGIDVAVLYHEPRALTEMKEATAKPLRNLKL